MKFKKDKPADVASLGLIADDPEYRPHRERLNDLQEQQVGFRRRLLELERGDGGPLLQEQAAAVARGAPVTEAVTHHDIESQRQAARSHLAVVEEAIAIASAEERKAFKEARVRFYERNRSLVADMAKKTAAALVTLGEVSELADELTLRFRDAGAGDPPPDLGPIGVGRIGMPTDGHSLYCAWLVGAILAGTIDRSMVPAHWLASWGILRDLAQGKDTDQGARAFAKARRDSADAALPSSRVRTGVRTNRR